MANICTNMLNCQTDNAENYKKILSFIEEKFNVDFINEGDDNSYFESEFDSKWSFPKEEFDELMKLLADDKSLYMSILSHELCSEYASFRIYRNREWNIRF